MYQVCCKTQTYLFSYNANHESLRVSIVYIISIKNRLNYLPVFKDLNEGRKQKLFLQTRRTIFMLTPDIQIPPMLFSSMKLMI